LSVAALAKIPFDELAASIRPAGYFRVKAKRIKNFIQHVVENHDGDLPQFLQQDLESLRHELLSISGIGPETADSIALYAGEHKVFVVDAYTHRIFYRHAWIEAEADYTAMQDYCMSELPADTALYNDFHAQLVMVGKNWCKKTKPDCEHCPLKETLPDGGMVSESDW
jgi:endonuclease-3 related protein